MNKPLDLHALANAPMTAPTINRLLPPAEKTCGWCGAVKTLGHQGVDLEHDNVTVPICYDCWADGEFDL